MKSFGLSFLLLAAISAKAQVAPETLFGGRDSRGAYQEVHIGEFHVMADYFDEGTKERLAELAKIQKEDPTFGFKDESWGEGAEVYFQDGALKTGNENSNTYPVLDKSRDYVTLHATVGFGGPQERISGIYTLSGVVTLVTGNFRYGPLNFPGGAGADFIQSSAMGYKMSGAYNYRKGVPFNKLGNGARDTGRIFMVRLTSHSTDPLTVKKLTDAMGNLVKVTYP